MRHFIWIFLIFLLVARIVTTSPEYSHGDKVRITSKVDSEPIRYQQSQRISLAGLFTYLPKYPEINYGDTVVVTGLVDLSKGKSRGELIKPDLIEYNEASGILYQFRANILKVYKTSLPEPHSSLVAGVTLGSRALITPDFWMSLRETGTAHVVVASGMNVTLVAGFLVAFLIVVLPRQKAIILAMAGIWAYAVIAGFDAPIVRAAIMASIGFGIQAIGRIYTAWRALFISALLMLIARPEWTTDLGFILSFVATASIMLFAKRIITFLKKIPSLLSQDFSTSLAAQIGVAPIIFVTFGNFNLLSPFINALVLWTIAPITIISMIGGVVGLFVPLVGRLILYIVLPLTTWFVAIIDLFS